MTRDAVIRLIIETLAQWHRAAHRAACSCQEGDQFGLQAASVVDALIEAV